MAAPKTYHYPRWPLIKKTASCLGWLIFGVLIFFAPLGRGKLIGIVPLLYSVAWWHFSLHPKWSYVIRLEVDNLIIGTHSYPWSKFDQLLMEREGLRRNIRLTSFAEDLDVVIKDDLPEFDSFAQTCLLYMNQKDETSDTNS